MPLLHVLLKGFWTALRHPHRFSLGCGIRAGLCTPLEYTSGATVELIAIHTYQLPGGAEGAVWQRSVRYVGTYLRNSSDSFNSKSTGRGSEQQQHKLPCQ
jgi:hypothetical protein